MHANVQLHARRCTRPARVHQARMAHATRMPRYLGNALQHGAWVSAPGPAWLLSAIVSTFVHGRAAWATGRCAWSKRCMPVEHDRRAWDVTPSRVGYRRPCCSSRSRRADIAICTQTTPHTPQAPPTLPFKHALARTLAANAKCRMRESLKAATARIHRGAGLVNPGPVEQPSYFLIDSSVPPALCVSPLICIARSPPRDRQRRPRHHFTLHHCIVVARPPKTCSFSY